MEQNEQPLNTRFWTLGTILLVLLNIVLIGAIIFGLAVVYSVYSPTITAWINRMIGL